ncbi:nucleotidyltransferase family protein [Flavobacterium sp. AED]|uniref:nucleotidyltransferase family protein n=1 Tax=Flavobacterium sp. AED TaxID=1423323 RepID=UPI0018CF8F71|nr:nucleotidyltransferase family protein [Flavobacterium sp. AED]
MDLIKQNILNIIKNSTRITSIIQTIGLISSENLMLTGGSLRNVIWNFQHYYREEYELEDCDIIFYNTSNLSKVYEETIKNKLEYLNPDINWSVKNQARMHIRNGHNPYKGIYDALTAFPETCSAVAIDKNWNIISPYGLDDLINLIVKPTPFCIENEIEVYHRRIKKKNWLDKWADLEVKRNTAHNSYYNGFGQLA